jgi:hypothetical protein
MDKTSALKAILEKVNTIYPQFDYYVEIYNTMNKQRPPDKIGVNIFYPNANKATHIKTIELPINTQDADFEQYILKGCEELISKIA